MLNMQLNFPDYSGFQKILKSFILSALFWIIPRCYWYPLRYTQECAGGTPVHQPTGVACVGRLGECYVYCSSGWALGYFGKSTMCFHETWRQTGADFMESEIAYYWIATQSCL